MLRHSLFAILCLSMAACASPPPRAQSELDPYRADYAMTRNGEAWATASVTLEKIRYQAEDAFRYSIWLRFADETVFDETFFSADDYSLLAKFINAGFGDDLSWNVYARSRGRIVGAQVFADARAPATLDFEAPANAKAGAFFMLLQEELYEGRRLKVPGADAGVSYWTEFEVAAPEKVKTAAGKAVQAWRVKRIVSLQPDAPSILFLSQDPPYLIAQQSPAQGIEWRLKNFQRIKTQ